MQTEKAREKQLSGYPPRNRPSLRAQAGTPQQLSCLGAGYGLLRASERERETAQAQA